MTPKEADRIYVERLRNLKPEERIKIASDLFETVKEIARAGILSQHPGIDEKTLNQELQRRLYCVSRGPRRGCGSFDWKNFGYALTDFGLCVTMYYTGGGNHE